jgi:hypothetical protein
VVRIKPLSIAIAGAACVTIGSAVTASSAQALVITNNFRVGVTQGLLTNQSFFGNFRYDDASLTGSGLETLNPSNGFQSLSFKFLGNTYTQSSDAGYLDAPPNQYPQLNFKGGSLLGLDYAVESLMSSGSIASFVINYDSIKGEPFFRAYDGSPFDSNTKSLAEGTVKYGIQAVPTPALLPGLIGLGVGILRKRRSVAKEQAVES